MKNTEQHEHAATGRTRNGNSVSAGFYSNFIFNWQSVAGNRDRLAPEAMLVVVHRTGGDRLQTQNLAKAPPGRTRSPGAPRGHPPEGRTGPPEPDVGLPTEKNNTKEGFPPNRTEVKSEKEGMNNNNKKMKHYKHLNFSTMKKQFLFLVVFVLAAFAGINVSYGQGAVAGDAPRGTGCGAGDPLHPIAGQPYVYKAASNQGGNYTFWATQDQNFITTTAGTTTNNISTMLTTSSTPAGLISTSANYGSANTQDNVTITWSDATIAATTAAAPTFVVVNNDGTCTNNLKVWKIDPIKAFTVDIRNMDHSTKAPLAYDAGDSQCFDQVRSAVYNGGTVNYDFGTQVMYFEVIAANFTASYTPTFEISGLGNTQTATIEWDYSSAFTAPTAAVAIANGTPVTSSVVNVDPTVTNTSTGVAIYVRVTITNHTYEGINSTPVTLAVDGQNSVGDWDIDNGNGTTCVATTGADQKDVATQTLNPRPDVTPVAPSPFVGGDNVN